MSLLDKLVVQLQLDAKGFSPEARKTVEQLREVEKQAQATGSGMERDGVKAASFFSGVRREALAMFAVFTAGKSLKAFIGDTTKANAQLDYMSQRLNMDPAGLNRLETAAKAAGGSFGEVTQAFGTLQQRMTDPQELAKVSQAFARLGVSDFMDKSGNIQGDIVARLNRSVHQNHINSQVALGYMRDLNFGEGMINQVLMDPKKFADLQNQLKNMPAPSKAATEASRQLYQDWNILTQQSENLTNVLTAKLAPGLDQVVRRLLELERDHPDIAGAIGGITLAVGELSKAFGGLGGILAGMAGLNIIKRLFGGDAKAMLAAIEELKAMQHGLEKPSRVPVPSATPNVLSRLLSYGTAIVEGVRLNSEINSSRNEMNSVADAVKKGSVTNSPLFDAMASSVAKIEHADYGQMGGSSGKYAGRYQMSPDAIKEAAGQLGETAPTQAAFLADPAMQERYFKAYTKQNEWYLLRHSEQFRAMSDAQKLATLAYAHNQGAGGAADWLKTGVAGKDAFGTSGALYANNTMDALGQDAGRRSSIAEASAATSTDQKATTVLRYDAPKAAQDEAIKRLIDTYAALKDQHAKAAQSIGTGEVSRMAASVTAGDSPGSVSNTSNNTTNSANLHGDVIIHTNATDASGIARGIHDGLRQELAARSLMGVQ